MAGEARAGLRQTPPDVAQLVRALRESQEAWEAARREVKVLAERNLRLRRELLWLTQREQKASRLAHHDELTGLPNRRLLLDRFNQAVGLSARQYKQVAVLSLDLNGFKKINDTLGHATGDKILQAVADRLIDCIRSADTACRYGGDEFVVMLPEIESPEAALAVAHKIGMRLAAPYLVAGREVGVTASIGIAMFPGDGASCRDLVGHADIAMYRAKALFGVGLAPSEPSGGHPASANLSLRMDPERGKAKSVQLEAHRSGKDPGRVANPRRNSQGM